MEMTTKTAEALQHTTKAKADIAAERNCLRCSAAFWSEGFGERICGRCKGTVAWRSALPGDSGQSRRRSSGRSS